MRAIPNFGCTILALGFLATSYSAHALSLCGEGFVIGTPPTTCGEASVTGNDGMGNSFNGSPVSPNFIAGAGGGTASVTGGFGALSGSASATAALGVLRLSANSSDSSGPGVSTFASSHARATFTDQGTVNSSTLAIGTPVQAVATVSLLGTTVNQAGVLEFLFLLASQTQGTLVNTHGNGVFTLNLTVGESLVMDMALEIFADSATEGSVVNSTASADFSNSAHFFLDFTTPGVTFDTLGEHDYRSAAAPAATPLPAALPLFAASLGVLGFVSRRRKQTAVA